MDRAYSPTSVAYTGLLCTSRSLSDLNIIAVNVSMQRVYQLPYQLYLRIIHLIVCNRQTHM